MKLIKFFFLIYFTFTFNGFAENLEFLNWKKKFKILALKNNISENTFDKVFKNVRFLPKVIEYDRYQPEFYEDTKTYISKRSSKNKVKNGINFYSQNKKLILDVEKKYKIEKELLLALMGIETNFGKYVGKMDILSSLATLSFDKRRSEFFTKELLTLLKLIDDNQVNFETLYGSWAGAFGFFQFMPSTINGYAIYYDKNYYLDLKNNNYAFASAANYLNKMGWNKDTHCFYKIKLSEDIPEKYLNTSAKKIINKKKLKFFKKFIINKNKFIDIDENELVAIITPDKTIVDNSDKLNPAYVIFDNYEIILRWNRSLRFALAVCSLKENFRNEL